MELEWRQWRRRSLFLVTCGSVLAGTLLFWYLRHRRRWSLPPQSQSTRSQGRSTKLRHYSLSHCTIDVIDSGGACEEILQSKTPQSLHVIGLDCEWVNKERGGRSPVALLQLAFLDGHCLLVRLCKTNEIPSTLLDILQDNRIFKFGVAIENDAQKLQTGFGVELAGCVDLRHIAVRCGLRQRGLGLRGLAARLLNVELDKSWRLRCSDWEAEQLSEQQVKYAASDAAIALDILKALLHIKMGHEKIAHQLSHPHSESDLESSISSDTPSIMKSNPDPKGRKRSSLEKIEKLDTLHEISDSLLGSEADSVLAALCQGVVDVVYKMPKNTRGSGLQSGGVQQPKRHLHSSCVRKTPLYDNCCLLAPDGSLLSVVDHKKIQWYLDRHLGTLIFETPPTLQLTFEPAGKPGKDREYYLVQKENICVVCGYSKDCIRKNIVPQEYRKLFPAELKDHISHDILLMCMSCHQRATMHGDQFKKQLAREYQAPLSSTSNAKFKQDPKLVQVVNFSRALLSGHPIPESRRRELLAGLAEYWKCMPDDLTESMIEDASQVDTRLCNVNYCPHAEVVVKRIRETEGVTGLLAFQTRWRQHFLDSMKPRFLPDLWSVDHNPH